MEKIWKIIFENVWEPWLRHVQMSRRIMHVGERSKELYKKVMRWRAMQ